MYLWFFKGEAFFAGQPTDGLPTQIVQLVPEPIKKGLANRYTTARYWESSALIHENWESNYAATGPTAEQCNAAATAPHSYLDIPASSVYIDVNGVRYTALHVSLCQLGSYAQIATDRINCFLRTNLGAGNTLGDVAPACSCGEDANSCIDGGGAPAARAQCKDSCQYSSDGDCDDGGPGAEFSGCDLGTDCVDCSAGR